MDLLMNGLLMAASLFAGGYCWVLGRRVSDLKSLDKGLGGAIVTLTRQVELARSTLEEARASSRDSRQDLAQLIAKAEGAAGQLRILLAAAPRPGAPAAETPAAATPAVAPVAAAAPAEATVAAAAPAPPAPPAAAVTPPPAQVPTATLHQLPTPAPAVAPPDPAPRPPAQHLAEIPKPRALAPIENPLRRAKPDVEPHRSEDEILDTLSALAGGR